MSIIGIKQIDKPVPGAHWSYGSNYMRRISKNTAASLCGMYPLPSMGCETIVAVKRDPWRGNERLVVQNISGDYYVASCDRSIDQWPEIFGVQIINMGD